MELYVARQPIFDAAGRLDGYELLYRSHAASLSADGASREQMSLDVLIQSVLEIGIERITGGSTAYLNFSRRMLLTQSFDLLDPARVVIELLEDVISDDPVVASCARLAAAGYRLALDDYEPGGPQDRLLPYTSIVKVDVLGRSLEEICSIVDALHGRPIRLLAERIETPELRDTCRRLGFQLFQGYFFSRPEVISGRSISTGQLAILRLLRHLRNDYASDRELTERIRRDPSLSYMLLRMLNEGAGQHRPVQSIGHALQLLGRRQLRRWLALFFASSLSEENDVDDEAVHGAVARGRMLEQLAFLAGMDDQSDLLFMLGLFSQMDALLGAPMDELLAPLDLNAEVRAALISREGPLAVWLNLAEAYEQGDWGQVEELAKAVGAPPRDLARIYLDSLSWAREQAPAATA